MPFNTKPEDRGKSIGLRHGVERLARADQGQEPPTAPSQMPVGGQASRDLQRASQGAGVSIISPTEGDRRR
jgi:hypothetical protein